MGGGRTFAYPGQSTPKQFCDLCHGDGRNDAQPCAAAYDPDLAQIARLGVRPEDIAAENLARDWADAERDNHPIHWSIRIRLPKLQAV